MPLFGGVGDKDSAPLGSVGYDISDGGFSFGLGNNVSVDPSEGTFGVTVLPGVKLESDGSVDFGIGGGFGNLFD